MVYTESPVTVHPDGYIFILGGGMKGVLMVPDFSLP